MNKKKIGATLAAVLMATSVVGFAAETNTNQTRTRVEQRQVSELNSTRGESNAKWTALTQAQKNEVYKIEEEIAALKKKQIDKLLSLGVIDKTTADAQKKSIDDRLSSMKSNSQMPRIKGGKKDGYRKLNPNASQNTTSTNSSK